MGQTVSSGNLLMGVQWVSNGCQVLYEILLCYFSQKPLRGLAFNTKDNEWVTVSIICSNQHEKIHIIEIIVLYLKLGSLNIVPLYCKTVDPNKSYCSPNNKLYSSLGSFHSQTMGLLFWKTFFPLHQLKYITSVATILVWIKYLTVILLLSEGRTVVKCIC